MKHKKYCRAISLGVLVLSLAACNTTPTAEESAAAAAGASTNGSTQTYAFSGGEGYEGKAQRDENGEVINSMKAPSPQTYYFSFDNSSVRSQDQDAIKVQANYLITHPTAKIRLEGNTDSRGSREYNIGLGWRRDQAVARLFEQEGVQPKQITMVSYGKERPAVLGDTPDAWRLNRRVNLVYEAY